jgi:hypothetical protein
MTLAVNLLRTPDEIFESMRKARREEIEKGLKRHRFSESPTLRGIKMWSKMCVPPLDWALLEKGELLVATDAADCIDAGVLLMIREDAVIQRVVASKRDDAEANAALTWYAMLWARGAGFHEYDLGGYNLETHPGISLWKEGFGGELVERERP